MSIMSEPYTSFSGVRRCTESDDNGKPIACWYQCAACGEWFDEWSKPPAMTTREALCWQCAEARRANVPTSVRVDVPNMYAGADMSHFEAATASKITAWPVKTPLMFLGGPTGRGKTYACWALVRHHAACGRKIRCDDAGMLRCEWLDAGDRRARLGIELMNTSALILDDISRPAATDGWAEFIVTLIDERSKERRPTLITSNATPDSYTANFGEVLSSRLKLFTQIKLSGGDRRVSA